MWSMMASAQTRSAAEVARAYALPLVYTHLYGMLFFAGVSLTVGLLWMTGAIERARMFAFAVASTAVVAAVLLCLLLMVRTSNTASWLEPQSVAAFFEYAYNYSHKNPVEALYVLLPLALIFRVYRRDQVLAGVLAGSALITFLLAFVISELRQSILNERYTMIYFPSLVLLAAAFWSGERRLQRPTVSVAIAAGVVMSAFINLMWVNPYASWMKQEP